MDSTKFVACDLPTGLRMRAIDSRRVVVVISFSLGPLAALSPAELDVARLANAGLSNAAIGGVRRTSEYTVARQISAIMKKLGVGSRLGLATIPELRL